MIKKIAQPVQESNISSDDDPLAESTICNSQAILQNQAPQVKLMYNAPLPPHIKALAKVRSFKILSENTQKSLPPSFVENNLKPNKPVLANLLSSNSYRNKNKNSGLKAPKASTGLVSASKSERPKSTTASKMSAKLMPVANYMPSKINDFQHR